MDWQGNTIVFGPILLACAGVAADLAFGVGHPALAICSSVIGLGWFVFVAMPIMIRMGSDI